MPIQLLASSAHAAQFAEFRDELMANYLHALLGYSALLEEQLERDATDSDAFVLLVSESLEHFEISKKAFSDEFGVHPSTVGRWSSGTAIPNQIVRPVVLRWIHSCIEKEICDYKPSYPTFEKVGSLVHTKLNSLVSR